MEEKKTTEEADLVTEGIGSDLFPQLVHILPGKEDGTGENGEKITTSLSAVLESGSDLSDVQSALLKLFPKSETDESHNLAMIGRIAPEVFLPALKLKTVNDLMKLPPGASIDVVTTLLNNYYTMSIGLDGKGRFDMIELVGAGKEATAEAEEATNKLLGI